MAGLFRRVVLTMALRMTRPLLLLATLLALLLPGAVTAAAADGIAVVVARDGPDLDFDRATLKDVFLKRIVIDRAGHLLVPVNLPAEHPLRHAFSKTLLDRDPEALQSYWNSRYFQGVSPPYVVASQEAMVRFVAATPWAIGYVAPCYVDERVRVILRLPADGALKPALRKLCP
jgi:ABC-type phosphate transport system substrate-binding protein